LRSNPLLPFPLRGTEKEGFLRKESKGVFEWTLLPFEEPLLFGNTPKGVLQKKEPFPSLGRTQGGEVASFFLSPLAPSKFCEPIGKRKQPFPSYGRSKRERKHSIAEERTQRGSPKGRTAP